jgi:hypothetical protein
MGAKTRIKLLEALAQATTSTTSTTSTTTAPAPNTQAGPAYVAGAPYAFDPYSYYPTITLGWGTANTTWIRKLCDTINNAIYFLSQGQLDLNKIRMVNFVVDISKYPDRILTAVVKFALQVYRMILTHQMAPFAAALSTDDKKEVVAQLKSFLTYFQIPDGSVNAALVNKIGGNLKQVLFDTLTQIR